MQSSRRRHPGEGNDNDNSEGDEDMLGGENRTRKGKRKQDGMGKGKVKGKWKGKWKGKATEKGKGKGKEYSNGKGIFEQTPGGDDISHAGALQLQKRMCLAESDTKG